jgi:hypothetical protein
LNNIHPADYHKAMTRKRTNQPRSAEAAMRVITTKHKTYVLPASIAGTPIKDAFPEVKFPPHLEDAKLYPTPDGEVLAVPLPRKHGRAKRRDTSQKPAF